MKLKVMLLLVKFKFYEQKPLRQLFPTRDNEHYLARLLYFILLIVIYLCKIIKKCFITVSEPASLDSDAVSSLFQL